MTPFRLFFWSYSQALPKPHPRWSFGQREHWVLHTSAASSLLFKPGAPPPPPPQSQPAEQLNHSSSNTQGGRTRLCTRQMVSALCNILGQGRYFQKGFSFFYFISFVLSHASFFHIEAKNKCQTGHKEGHKPFLESSNEQMEKATSHLTARACWCPRKIVAMVYNSHLKA